MTVEEARAKLAHRPQARKNAKAQEKMERAAGNLPSKLFAQETGEEAVEEALSEVASMHAGE